MKREYLTTLRPTIANSSTEKLTEIESFHHEVLRPILKFQHTFILELLSANPHFKQLVEANKTSVHFREKLNQFLQHQSGVRNQLLGAIIGLLTTEELAIYWKNVPEINRRIYQLITQRVLDSFC
jgi:hypothetical protein